LKLQAAFEIWGRAFENLDRTARAQDDTTVGAASFVVAGTRPTAPPRPFEKMKESASAPIDSSWLSLDHNNFGFPVIILRPLPA
jgi:hypothetical protein